MTEAVGLTAAALVLGLWAFGPLAAVVFTAGFLGGLALWLALGGRGRWADIRIPYWIALGLFVAHRIEEKQWGFFAFLSGVTGVPTPGITSIPVISLVVISVGAWLLVPALMRREHPLGYYLAWTFFASLGVTELAHFVVFPWLIPTGPGYVPGMVAVLVLAPVAWWGCGDCGEDSLVSSVSVSGSKRDAGRGGEHATRRGRSVPPARR
ncbi:hypothetical protein [Mycolicibacterium tokaiense]|uniref:hypothetical protein n=1 Tax=Mycolicibacterium tokaiense TaxID=39695 RepID=UPI001F2608CB|nr:hypothetical protein [Mycolicibacterium tokaiense]